MRARSACTRARAQLHPLWLLSLNRSAWLQMWLGFHVGSLHVHVILAPYCKSLATTTWWPIDASVSGGAPDILCCAPRASPAARARDPCGAHAPRMRWLFAHGMPPRRRTRPADRVHPLRGDAVHEHVHMICIVLRAVHKDVATRPRPALHVHNLAVMEHVMAGRRGF